MSVGTISYFNQDKGYGFIRKDDGSGDLFLHIKELIGGSTADDLIEGTRVSFEEVPSTRKPGSLQAKSVKIIF